jgi:Protein of unknown function (DUF3318)
MEPTVEIRRLLDVMPASGRMMTKIISKPEQQKVMESPFPLPWNQTRPIWINFDLWRRFSRPQRDLLLLSQVCWLMNVKWFKPDLYQGIAVAGLLAGTFQFSQGDSMGILVSGGLSAIALYQVWRTTRSNQAILDGDEAAIKVAIRRGYEESEAARYLFEAIELVSQLERRPLDFTDLVRCQNLKAIAGISPVGVPDTIRQE